MSRAFTGIMAAAVLLLLSACATAPKITEADKAAAEGEQLEPAERHDPTVQEEESLKIFTQILDLVDSSAGRSDVLPEIERLYAKIITDYPEAPLAQESYWKLIQIYTEDYSPPKLEKAETRYQEFVEKYPESILMDFVTDTLAYGYHRGKKWNELKNLCQPVFHGFFREGKQPRASLMYLYAEASYHLGNISDARKGYGVVVELFPRVREGIKSSRMLRKIEESTD